MPVAAGPEVLRASSFQKLHDFTRGAPRQRTARPVHALTVPSQPPSVSPAPSLLHVMPLGPFFPPFVRGVIAEALPQACTLLAPLHT